MLRQTLRQLRRLQIRQKVIYRARRSCSAAGSFDFEPFRQRIRRFLDGLAAPEGIAHRYAASCQAPTLYGSAYACMTRSLLGDLAGRPAADKLKWLEYFDSFQSGDDGLFYDPAVDSDLYRRADWWGARHLALHLVSAYSALGSRPKQPFHFLGSFGDKDRMRVLLDQVDWAGCFSDTDDVDNQLMNIGCLLQYQRDAWSDDRAAAAVAFLQDYLLERVNPETGMWGRFDSDDPERRSRMVQFAYHLLPLFFYDKIPVPHADRIVEQVLATQNRLGGFGVRLNSSACEDIDSIDLLVRLASAVPGRRADIDAALRRALPWVLCNQVDDGGLVFRLYEPFVYGHPQTSSQPNEGAMLPTWFRTLSLAYLTHHLGIPNGFVMTRCPGYEFPAQA